MRISKIFIYDEPRVPEIKITCLARFISDLIGVEVEIRENIFEYLKSSKTIASELSSIRVLNPYSPFERHDPTSEEIEFEDQFLYDRSSSNNIILYDGFELQNILKKAIVDHESNSSNLHIAFTTKLTCTYDLQDCRYHGRAVICSNPSIVSTTGIIEAPAKPRAFYTGIYQNMTHGLNLDALRSQFRGRFLEYHDKNLDKVVRGYVLQTIFYYYTGNPFCDSKECVLYNAHWQEELLHSQIVVGKLCDNHQRILQSMRKFE